MRDQAHENLIELLRRFMDEPTARAAHADIQAGERYLDAYPAPRPEARLVATMKTQMAVAALRRRRIARLVHGSLAAAAAVIVLALIGLPGHGPANRPRMSYATIIPPAIWDSDDITTTDLDLAYFSSQIRQIEAQMRALETGDAETIDNDTSDEIEMELLALQAEFWKG
jgi:hypothetical protein